MLEGLITFNVTCPLCMRLPEVPVTVIGESPRGVPGLVAIVNVEVFAEASLMLTEVGLKFAEAPEGNPVTPRFTMPVKPADGVIVIVYCALEVGTTVRNDGATPTSKSGVAENGATDTKVL